MHCPRCGQQQASEQTKFCSRCGFQLGLVAELLTHGGFLPQLADLSKGKAKFFTRKNGVIFSVIWFLFWLMITIFFAIADAEEPAGVSIIFGIFTALMSLILSFAFLPKARKTFALPPIETQPAPGLYGNPQMGALPPQQSQSATDYVAPAGSWRTPNTGEFAQPGSVTDSTTKLLEKDDR